MFGRWRLSFDLMKGRREEWGSQRGRELLGMMARMEGWAGRAGRGDTLEAAESVTCGEER